MVTRRHDASCCILPHIHTVKGQECPDSKYWLAKSQRCPRVGESRWLLCVPHFALNVQPYREQVVGEKPSWEASCKRPEAPTLVLGPEHLSPSPTASGG